MFEVVSAAAFGLGSHVDPLAGRPQSSKFPAAFLDLYFARAVARCKEIDRLVEILC